MDDIEQKVKDQGYFEAVMMVAKLTEENEAMKHTLDAVNAWLDDIDMVAEPGFQLHPALKMVRKFK